MIFVIRQIGISFILLLRYCQERLKECGSKSKRGKDITIHKINSLLSEELVFSCHVSGFRFKVTRHEMKRRAKGSAKNVRDKDIIKTESFLLRLLVSNQAERSLGE